MSSSVNEESWDLVYPNGTKLHWQRFIISKLNEEYFELFTESTATGVSFEEECGSKIDSNNDTDGESGYSKLPDALTKLTPYSWHIICGYAVVFILAGVGNLIELLSVWRRRKKCSSAMNRLLLHLCIADIVVVFMVALVEVFWRLSIGWYGGDLMCKLIQYFRAFGLYLSSLMLICLSLDRFYAVIYPFRAVDASRRVKVMLTVAWTCAALLAAPQCMVFRLQIHPYYPAFKQCNSAVSGVLAEAINIALSLSFMYFLPILVILVSYGNIIIKLARQSDCSRMKIATYFCGEVEHR